MKLAIIRWEGLSSGKIGDGVRGIFRVMFSFPGDVRYDVSRLLTRFGVSHL